MSKRQTPDHRVVTRSADEKIIEDLHFQTFAAAKPVYDQLAAAVPDGNSVALQHGARVILEAK